LWCPSLCSAFNDHYTSSKGFIFLSSLHTSSLSSSSLIASTLTWWRILFSCFLANLSISFVTISIGRSLWRSAFLIYQGASTMFLSTLFWNHWMMSVLLCFVYVHSRMPSVHTGYNICTASPYCVSTGPIFFPSANTFFYILVQALRVFSWHEPLY